MTGAPNALLSYTAFNEPQEEGNAMITCVLPAGAVTFVSVAAEFAFLVKSLTLLESAKNPLSTAPVYAYLLPVIFLLLELVAALYDFVTSSLAGVSAYTPAALCVLPTFEHA